MQQNITIKSRTVLLFCLAGLFAILWTPAWAFNDVLTGPRLSDQELDQIRGGYSGFYFGVYFEGYLDTLGNISGFLSYNGDVTGDSGTPGTTDTELPPPGSSVAQSSQGGAVISAYVGDFNGASGIFQISQSPGSYNVIQNNLIIQLTFINVADESALPALRAMLPW